MQMHIPVEPIRPGYPYVLTLVLPETFWESEQLATGRLVAHFRDTVPGALVWQADSEAGTPCRSISAAPTARRRAASADAGC